jgi:hypothetical protein
MMHKKELQKIKKAMDKNKKEYRKLLVRYFDIVEGGNHGKNEK